MTMTEDVPGVELVHADTAATMVLAGETPEEILQHAEHIARALKDLIESQDLSVGMGGGNKHVEVGGWQAAGAMLGALGGTPLHAETVWSRRVENRPEDIVYESRCEVRTLDGKVVGAAESLCSSQERNWRSADEFAIKGMAETRAESRAYRRAIGWVIKLAGYSPTPAEEMRAEPGGAGPPAWAVHVRDVTPVAHTLTTLLETAGVTDAAVVSRIGQRIFDDCEGGIPLCVARAIDHITNAVRPRGAETPAGAAPVDAEATEEPPAAESITDTQEKPT